MEYLGDDVLLKIIKKVAHDDAFGFCSFMRTNKRHCALSRTGEALRALNNDCIWLLIEFDLTPPILKFMYRLWNAGHFTFCLLRCTQQLLHRLPNYDMIKWLLRWASEEGYEGSKYFDVLMRAVGFSGPDSNYEKLFADFWDLLMTRNLAQHRSWHHGRGYLLNFYCPWYKRMLPWFTVRRTFCTNWRNCADDGRRGNYYGYLPATDDAYGLRNFCVRCRLGSDVRWMLEVFGFSQHDRE